MKVLIEVEVPENEVIGDVLLHCVSDPMPAMSAKWKIIQPSAQPEPGTKSLPLIAKKIGDQHAPDGKIATTAAMDGSRATNTAASCHNTPPQPQAQVPDERVSFEKYWFGDDAPAHARERGSDGESYKYIATQNAWTVWKARAALPSTPQPQAQVPTLKVGRIDGVEAAVKFIERKASEYAADYGYEDLGALVFGNEAKTDYYNNLMELADEIRDLSAAPQTTLVAAQVNDVMRKAKAALQRFVEYRYPGIDPTAQRQADDAYRDLHAATPIKQQGGKQGE